MATSVILAGPDQAAEVARLVVALTREVAGRAPDTQEALSMEETTERCRAFIESGRYAVYLALEEDATPSGVGVLTLCESHALHARGSFGVIQELHVDAHHRARGVGGRLMEAAFRHARAHNWSRLELCTPPLPEFVETMAFYKRHGFEITSGRKMKHTL